MDSQVKQEISVVLGVLAALCVLAGFAFKPMFLLALVFFYMMPCIDRNFRDYVLAVVAMVVIIFLIAFVRS